ncbi:cob(I)yrinic acid a,c-diamide adenosyltransferase [Desulfacinum hydrothermale DSM 13146]|uniref:corrinoid adenosyltransferase n=1 Tax=Desulfacinum hydrothermale DSM 13146 TaxID=1121390 RepID=A0A1W1X7Y6_9BACT|nr:cob(I)yrinic acid a,c-diamide adenosyltransferase [Desulfacinum hydrothermale]SMC20072.1 cob(I)yrinic acid a,c-diamide adenosyltransferase [Desulfacinum hydrothermale DSM 13146]
MSPNGLFLVFTGEGKGKTTAALGQALRAAGHGMRVLILQFIKGSWHYGELEAVKRLPTVTLEPLGRGFTWKKESLEEDRRLAQRGWEKARQALLSGSHDLIILDELNNVLAYGLLDVHRVVDDIRRRRPSCHVVATGRGAPRELVREADCVTEMIAVKHHYHTQGVRAQKGIEF